MIIGHSEESQGAVNYLGESEYSFNKRIAGKVKEFCKEKGIEVEVYERCKGGYVLQAKEMALRLQEDKVAISIHLHFNSFDGNAKGCEALILPTLENADDLIANLFTKRLHSTYGFVNRGTKSVNSKHRGFVMMNEVRRVGVLPVVVEPCFANRKTAESTAIFENEDLYASVLAKVIEDAEHL